MQHKEKAESILYKALENEKNLKMLGELTEDILKTAENAKEFNPERKEDLELTVKDLESISESLRVLNMALKGVLTVSKETTSNLEELTVNL